LMMQTYAQAADADARRQALLFQIFVERESSRAARQPDGLVALIDSWTLAAQLGDYLRQGDGATLFPDQRDRLLALLDHQGETARAGIQYRNEPKLEERATSIADRWVADYPIHGTPPQRKSTAPLLTLVDSETNRSVFGSVASMQETMERMESAL